MKAKPQFASIFVAACISVFLSLPAFARPANPSQDQETAQTRSGAQDKTQHDKHKDGTGPGKEVAKGVRKLAKAQPRGRGVWARALPERPGISLLCTLARPALISAKA